MKTADRFEERANYYKWKGFKLVLGSDGHIVECVYGYDFPAEIPIEGLFIGMPIEAARQVQPKLRFLGPQPFSTRDHYDLVAHHEDWDLVLEEVSGKVWSISAVPEGQAHTRAAFAAESISSKIRSWHRAQEQEHWTTIDDPDALLQAWLASEEASAPWATYPKSINCAYAKWLRQATPDQWHEATRGHNWSYSAAPLFYISRHSSCDIATALYIFHAAGPTEYLRQDFDPGRIPTHQHVVLRLIVGIRDRLLGGFYWRSEIAFDPVREFGPRWCPVDIGQDLPSNLGGREPEPVSIEDGYPTEVWTAVGETFRGPTPSAS